MSVLFTWRNHGVATTVYVNDRLFSTSEILSEGWEYGVSRRYLFTALSLFLQSIFVGNMRIISGKHGGRRFDPPKNMPARPTTDIAKEGLFNILQNNLDFEELTTLDLFGGTGSISYELASRGCTNLTLVEQDSKTVQFIKKTVENLQLEGFVIFPIEVFYYLRSCTGSFDFIFAGPPYALKNIDDIPAIIFEKKLLKPGGWFVLEHTPRNNYEKHPNFLRSKNYGTTIFSFFENAD